jgi:hypothetical protein
MDLLNREQLHPVHRATRDRQEGVFSSSRSAKGRSLRWRLGSDGLNGEVLITHRLLALALVVSGPAAAGSAPVAAPVAACPAAVQAKADRALQALEQRQQAEDTQLRSHPTASYATMNGPVLRELEKRQQRQLLADTLQLEAGKQQHCQLQGPDF